MHNDDVDSSVNRHAAEMQGVLDEVRFVCHFCVCMCICMYVNMKKQYNTMAAIMAAYAYIFTYKHTYIQVRKDICDAENAMAAVMTPFVVDTDVETDRYVLVYVYVYVYVCMACVYWCARKCVYVHIFPYTCFVGSMHE